MIKAPFPYFGGKTAIAPIVWDKIGPVTAYIEPFAGSAAVALLNPYHEHLQFEVLNDFDGMITNVWRSIKNSPDKVKEWIDWPMNELDLHARSEWVEEQRAALEGTLRAEPLTDVLRKDPHYHDPKIAGWWIWGMSCAIGDAFIAQKKAKPAIAGPRGVFGETFDADAVFSQLSKRLSKTRILCGDWKRTVTDSLLLYKTPVFVFLDPPYATTDRHDTYKHESYSVAAEVLEWSLEKGDCPGVQIALAGYEGDYDVPETWEKLAWKATGGYGNRGQGGTRGRSNAELERIWFSPGCQRLKNNIGILQSFL